MKLGCCYYPEHWPEEIWADDARRMVEMGLSLVRIGEFSWSRLEPEPGRYDWGWLDRAIAMLGDAGLSVILGTPTATPPKWLVDQMPDMIPVGADGNPRKFGSRRHYCFSHRGYREECARIVTAMAERYGDNPAVTGWQTDNEYGCHQTTLSYSKSAAAAFRIWLKDKYGDVAALNSAWGNVFWSMEYRSFDEIDPPNLTVTEPNPAHVLDYRRFASDEVVSFNKLQADILRRHSPGRDIIHNFMGFVTDFDHHDVGKDLDVASWDSYPLGFLEQYWFSDEEKTRYARQGHPDIAAFHHDLYRGCSEDARWGVMEQQPGPVNWARWNPAPLPGMVKLWTMEAAAHGAEFCSYFRWRQVPFAQEQMHAGLLRPDSEVAQGGREVAMVAEELAGLKLPEKAEQAAVALVFSYEADWLFHAQPQGQDFRYIELAFEMYSALRQLGPNIDIVSPDAPLDGYQMVVIPSLPVLTDDIVARLESQDIPVLFGPRSGSKTADFQIPPEMPPGPLQRALPIKVDRVSSLRPGSLAVDKGERRPRWIEEIRTDLQPMKISKDGIPLAYERGKIRYLAAWPSQKILKEQIADMLESTGFNVQNLTDGVRIRRAGNHIFAFNYGAESVSIDSIGLPEGAASIGLKSGKIEPAGCVVWTQE